MRANGDHLQVYADPLTFRLAASSRKARTSRSSKGRAPTSHGVRDFGDCLKSLYIRWEWVLVQLFQFGYPVTIMAFKDWRRETFG